jgi:sugar (pentulose or hexulose) kinase
MIICGLDLGTTTITGLLWDGAPGRVLALARRRNDAALPVGRSTRAEQDPGRLYGLALEVLAELAAAAGTGRSVDALALTGQKHGLLCAGAHLRPLTPLISWQDRRTAEPLAGENGPKVLDRLHARLEGLDWQPNGCRIQHGYGGATLFWLTHSGALPPGTRYACTAAGWLAARLTGLPPATDPTFAASWGLYDLVHGRWNADLVRRLGLDGRLLPPVQPSGRQLGGLAPDVAARAGLPAGLPVHNPFGDTQASFLSAQADSLEGILPPERGQSDLTQAIFLNLGTGGQVCWAVPRFEAPGEAVETRPLPGAGHYLRVGASLCGGAAYAWLNRTVRAWLAEFGVEVAEEEVYARLNALATARDNPGGLRVRPTFLGVRGDPAVQGGAIEGITSDNVDLGALARATLTGIVEELYGLYAGHGGRQAGHSRIMAAGGGIWQNPVLPDLIAGRFGLPVRVLAQRETAALGAAAWVRYAVSPAWIAR